MNDPQLEPYRHTQRAPWYISLFALAALMANIAWVARAEPEAAAILLASALVVAVLGFSMQHLTVSDEGDRLAISFGPLPLFRHRIRYDDMVAVELGRTPILHGWGIQWTPWRSQAWSLSAGPCVIIRRRRGRLKLGTDDADRLAEFLRQRIAEPRY